MTNTVDVFICHASQDKDDFVRPLARALRDLGVGVWYDEFSIELGDSVSEKIDQGIANARFGIVVVSKSFIQRPWPNNESQSLVNRAVEGNLKILPIWHGVTKHDVMKHSPLLAGKFAIDTQKTALPDTALAILKRVRPDLNEQHHPTEHQRTSSGETLEELQTQVEDLRKQVSEFQCPFCGAPLSERIAVPCDPCEKYWDDRETYECGLEKLAGEIQHPCPSDPKFPSLNDYDLVCMPTSERSLGEWRCDARAKTPMAHKVNLDTSYGKSKDQALRKMKTTYLYRAGRMTNYEWFQAQTGAPSPS